MEEEIGKHIVKGEVGGFGVRNWETYDHISLYICLKFQRINFKEYYRFRDNLSWDIFISLGSYALAISEFELTSLLPPR